MELKSISIIVKILSLNWKLINSLEKKEFYNKNNYKKKLKEIFLKKTVKNMKIIHFSYPYWKS